MDSRSNEGHEYRSNDEGNADSFPDYDNLSAGDNDSL